MAELDIAFPFMGGTMAGQNVTECSGTDGCYAMVLSEAISNHRAWHEGMKDALRRSDSGGAGGVEPVADGPDDGIVAEGAGPAEVADPANPERQDGRQSRQRRSS